MSKSYRSFKTSSSCNQLVGLGTSLWLIFQVITLTQCLAVDVPHYINPNIQQVAQLSIDRLNLYIERQPNETYAALLARAQQAALTSVQQSFERNHQVSAVIVIVTAENDGLVAPVLSVQVRREQWEQQIKPQDWVTNFTSSSTLLGFEKTKPTSSDIPDSRALPPNAMPPEPPGSPL